MLTSPLQTRQESEAGRNRWHKRQLTGHFDRLKLKIEARGIPTLMAMKKGRKKHSGSSWISGCFVVITNEMIASRAYRKLTGTAIKVFILCMRKVKEIDRVDRFKAIFALTYAEAKKEGIAAASFWRAMAQLQEVGFIVCYMKGGLRCDKKTPTTYRLSLRWKQFGTPAFTVQASGQCEAINGDVSL